MTIDEIGNWRLGLLVPPNPPTTTAIQEDNDGNVTTNIVIQTCQNGSPSGAACCEFDEVSSITGGGEGCESILDGGCCSQHHYQQEQRPELHGSYGNRNGSSHMSLSESEILANRVNTIAAAAAAGAAHSSTGTNTTTGLRDEVANWRARRRISSSSSSNNDNQNDRNKNVGSLLSRVTPNDNINKQSKLLDENDPDTNGSQMSSTINNQDRTGSKLPLSPIDDDLAKKSKSQKQDSFNHQLGLKSSPSSPTTTKPSTKSSTLSSPLPGATAINRWGTESRCKGRITQSRSFDEDDMRLADNMEQAPVVAVVGDDVPELQNDDQTNRESHAGTTKKKTVVIIMTTVFCLIVTIGIVVALVIATSDKRQNKTNEYEDLVLTLQSHLIASNVVSNDWSVFDDEPLSPQSQAIHWMVYNDTEVTRTLLSSSSFSPSAAVEDNANYGWVRVKTRFALAVLYYSTNGKEWYNQYNFLSPNVHECSWTSEVE